MSIRKKKRRQIVVISFWIIDSWSSSWIWYDIIYWGTSNIALNSSVYYQPSVGIYAIVSAPLVPSFTLLDNLKSSSTWISAQRHQYSIDGVNTKETCLNVFFFLSLTRHGIKHKGLDHVIQLQASFFINTWYLYRVIPLVHDYTVMQAILCDWYATIIKKWGR